MRRKRISTKVPSSGQPLVRFFMSRAHIKEWEGEGWPPSEKEIEQVHGQGGQYCLKRAIHKAARLAAAVRKRSANREALYDDRMPPPGQGGQYCLKRAIHKAARLAAAVRKRRANREALYDDRMPPPGEDLQDSDLYVYVVKLPFADE